MFVSHMATIWASTLLKAHISPDRFGFLGSTEQGSPDNWNSNKDRWYVKVRSGLRTSTPYFQKRSSY